MKIGISREATGFGWWVLPLLWGCWQLAWADPPGSQDFPLLERFPRSEIDQYEQRPTPEYRLSLGSLRKVNGVVRVEEEKSVRGQLTRITYQIPPGHRPREVFAWFKEQLRTHDPQWLFECQGRVCGDSAYWANQQFQISKLYGLDREQAYLAARVGATHVALYATRRGNRRVYVQLDVVEPQAGGQAVARNANTTARFVVAADQVAAPDPALVERLLALLREGNRTEIWLLGHWVAPGDTRMLLDRSRSLAEEFKGRLVDAGAMADAVGVVGLGPLIAVEPPTPPRRVEVVVRQGGGDE